MGMGKVLRKLWFRRRGVSTMIAGVIVLSLFITAFVAMILVNQEYDSYQGTVDTMKQADLDSFSENLRAVSPGLVKGGLADCGGGNCTAYTLMVSDLVTNASSNLGVQIARIYVNSTYQPGCVDLCILSPAESPAAYTFKASERYVNPGEPLHKVTLYFPANITLPSNGFGLNTITLTTIRGRQFSFNWPLPPPGLGAGAAGGEGGTGLYIGPLVITFQKDLITYSTQVNQTALPIGGTNGGWIVHTPPLIIYVKIQTDVGTPSDVYLTSQSVIELAKFDSPGEIYSWFIVAPISITYCKLFHNQDPTIICDRSYGYYNDTAEGNNGCPYNQAPKCLAGLTLKPYVDRTPAGKPCIPYNSITCPNRYKIPRHERGNPVIVAFAAATAGSDSPQTGAGGFQGSFVTSYLGLTYVYNDQSGKGDYTYAVTLPFMAMCMSDTVSFADCGI
jgi:hypothetical protein